MDAPQLLEKYRTDKQQAARYHVSPRTYKRWRREGRAPPSILIGNKRYTHEDDDDAHLEALREEARAANGAKRRVR